MVFEFEERDKAQSENMLDMAICKQQRSRLIRRCNPGASAISITVSFLVFHRRILGEVLHAKKRTSVLKH